MVYLHVYELCISKFSASIWMYCTVDLVCDHKGHPSSHVPVCLGGVGVGSAWFTVRFL